MVMDSEAKKDGNWFKEEDYYKGPFVSLRVKFTRFVELLYWTGPFELIVSAESVLQSYWPLTTSQNSKRLEGGRPAVGRSGVFAGDCTIY